MHFNRSENHLQQNTSKAVANNNTGKGGISMPAVPVLQQKPLQKKEAEQHENQLENDVQTSQLKQVSADSGAIQRKVENKKLDDSTLGAIADSFFNQIDGLVKQAYEFAVTVPSLGPYTGLDGHTALWKEKWDDYLAGKNVFLMTATFGYVVESLVCNALGPFQPAAPTGCSIYYQVVSGGTRPDIVLKRSDTGADIAWVDLTAANSGGHIFQKDSWDKKVDRFAEVTYPSVDSSTFFNMKGNKDNTAPISSEDFEKRKKAVDEAYKLRKASWMLMGQIYKAGKYPIDIDKEVLRLFPDVKTTVIKSALQRDFKQSSIDDKLMPSILMAMGVDPGPWGYTTGTSQSEKAGEAWLTDHDKDWSNLATVTTKKDIVEEKKEKPDIVMEEGK
ncbi:hypothetical protein ACFGVR_23705 [Mucilaginibacter sp. AW1-3]